MNQSIIQVTQVAFLVFAACATSQSSPPPVTKKEPATKPAALPPVAAKKTNRVAVPPKAKLNQLKFLLADDVDLNNDGKPDRIEVECKPNSSADKGSPEYPQKCEPLEENKLTLRVNQAEVVIEDESLSEWGGKSSSKPFGFVIVDVTPKTPDRQFALQLICGGGECDHWNIYLFQYDGTVLKELWHGVPQNQITWKKNGSWSSDQILCEVGEVRDWQAKPDSKGNYPLIKPGREKVTPLSFRWNGTRVIKRRGKTFRRTAECEIRGRCPFVYAGDKRTLIGEILRDHIGSGTWSPDAINIPREMVTIIVLSIVVAEEKPDEMTWIDSVILEVGGTRISPDNCEPSWCKQDQKLFPLAFGQSIELSFSDVPNTGTIRLVVDGYYDLLKRRQ